MELGMQMPYMQNVCKVKKTKKKKQLRFLYSAVNMYNIVSYILTLIYHLQLWCKLARAYESGVLAPSRYELKYYNLIEF